MKAADTPIAERWASVHADAVKGLDADTKWLDSTVAQLIEELSRAEERVRVLTEAATAAQKLADAMETCHICKGAIGVDDGAAHCEDCNSDCDHHDGSECATLYGLHLELKRKLSALSTPAPEQPAQPSAEKEGE